MERTEPTVGTVLGHRYELVAEIGRGGCAAVFEAHDLRLDRRVAVKIPIGVAANTAKMSRFSREARVIASIHHPNVCAVLDSGVMEDEVPFLVMERLYGESVRAILTRTGVLPVADAVSIGLQLLSALDAVHAAGIVHRDIKPDNIVLVTRGGCDPIVKLLDFGLCRRSARRRSDEETMTCDGAIVGTPEYMAPEQVLGSTTLDVRVDIYAVGVLLYEILSGDRAFFSKTLRDILQGVMSKKIRPLRQVRRSVPASLEAIVARAMDRNPGRRHQSALELQDDLLMVKEELAALARATEERRLHGEKNTRLERSGAYPTGHHRQQDETSQPPQHHQPQQQQASQQQAAPEWELPTARLNRQVAPARKQRPTLPPPVMPHRPLSPRYSRTG